MDFLNKLKKSFKVEVLFFILAFCFIYFVMQSTFSKVDGDLVISHAVWGDFTTHISLIRSFSMGSNFPPEYPLYAGENMRYHYIFYFFAGVLERVGLPIDISLNLLSTLAYTAMLVFTYKLSYALFKSKLSAIISNLLIIFTPALSWLYIFFVGKEKISVWGDLLTKTKLYNVGPYDNQVLSLYWDLETFTNQRHLSFGIALGLAIIWYLHFSTRKWKYVIVILLLLVLSWAHKSIWLLAMGYIFMQLILSKKRFDALKVLLICILVSIPSLLFLNNPGTVTSSINWQLGFVSLKTDWHEFPFIKTELLRFFGYWLINWGISFVGLLSYLILAFKKKAVSNQAKYLIFSTTAAFIVCNLFNFTQDINANHKFFNFILVIASIFGARVIVILMRRKWLYSGWLVLVASLIGGILSIIPIVNYNKITLPDIPKNTIANWISKNTPADSKFLVVTDDVFNLYLSGRRLIGFFPHSAWSFGYDFALRKATLEEIFQGKSAEKACRYFSSNDLEYMFIEKNRKEYLEKEINYTFLNSLSDQVFESGTFEIRKINCN